PDRLVASGLLPGLAVWASSAWTYTQFLTSLPGCLEWRFLLPRSPSFSGRPARDCRYHKPLASRVLPFRFAWALLYRTWGRPNSLKGELRANSQISGKEATLLIGRAPSFLPHDSLRCTTVPP